MFFSSTITIRRILLFAFLAIGITGVLNRIIHSPAFARRPAVFTGAILFDLTVVVTGLFYGVVARPLRLPISRTLLVARLMLRLAGRRILDHRAERLRNAVFRG